MIAVLVTAFVAVAILVARKAWIAFCVYNYRAWSGEAAPARKLSETESEAARRYHQSNQYGR